MEGKPFKVNCELYWAHINTPNPMSDKGDYTIDLCNLSDAACKKIEEAGGEVKFKDNKQEQGKFVTVKSRIPIKVFDAEGNAIPDDVKVGNGSKAVVLISPWQYSFRGKKGIRWSTKQVVVTDLVEYSGGVDVDIENDVL